MEPIRILLVEDQTLMRQGLKTILDLEPGLHVVGEASDGEAGVQAALELRPDVILMDVQLPKAQRRRGNRSHLCGLVAGQGHYLDHV
jgi:DNA-binding NarL/FixJ family response regulator